MDPSKKNEYPNNIYPFNTSMYPFPLTTPGMSAPNFSVPPPQIPAPQIPPIASGSSADDFSSTPYQRLSTPSPYSVPPPTLSHHERHIMDRKFKYESTSNYESKSSRHNKYQRTGSTSEQYSNRHSDRNRVRGYDRDMKRERSYEGGHGRSHERSSSRYSDRSDYTRQREFHKSESRHSSKSRDKDKSRASSSRRSTYSPSAQSKSDRPHRIKSEEVKSEESERDRLLSQWRSNYCETSEDIAKKLEQLVKDEEKECWIRSSPAELYYKRNAMNEVGGTARLDALCNLFDEELIKRGERARGAQPPTENEPKKRKHRVCRHKCNLVLMFRNFNLEKNIFYPILQLINVHRRIHRKRNSTLTTTVPW